ncbi:hypothetical protein CsSME_00040726 [Camellia sinensis var. sinensis]
MASFFFCPLRWFLVLFHHIVEWAGNSERSEQGREGDLCLDQIEPETPMDIKPSIIEGENFCGNLDNPV